MSRRWDVGKGRLATPALGLLILVFHGGDLAAQSERQRFALGTGTIAIYNLAGELTVEPGSGSEVVVEVERGGADASQLRIETGPRQGMQTLRVIYPGDQVVYPPLGRGTRSSVDVGADGTFRNDHSAGWLGKRRVTVSGTGGGVEAWANVHVSVPRGQKLRLQWVAGATHVGAVEGDVRVDNSSSPVEVRGLRGKLVVDTGSGEVSLKEVQGDIVVDTGSGSVTIVNARGGTMGWGLANVNVAPDGEYGSGASIQIKSLLRQCDG